MRLWRRVARSGRVVLVAVAARDERVAERVGRVDHAGADRVMRLLSAGADHSKLWLVVAVGAAGSGQPALRRGAVSGLVSAAAASLVVNQGVKRAFPRKRPEMGSYLPRRRARHVPTSGSFPSGHAASAAAFATGMGLAEPRVTVVLVPLAAAVAWSRVHTGVHFASDVAVGSVIGAAIACAVHATATRPRRVDEDV